MGSSLSKRAKTKDKKECKDRPSSTSTSTSTSHSDSPYEFPSEVLNLVLEYLNRHDAPAFALTCKQFRQVVRQRERERERDKSRDKDKPKVGALVCVRTQCHESTRYQFNSELVLVSEAWVRWAYYDLLKHMPKKTRKPLVRTLQEVAIFHGYYDAFLWLEKKVSPKEVRPLASLAIQGGKLDILKRLTARYRELQYSLNKLAVDAAKSGNLSVLQWINRQGELERKRRRKKDSARPNILTRSKRERERERERERDESAL